MCVENGLYETFANCLRDQSFREHKRRGSPLLCRYLERIQDPNGNRQFLTAPVFAGDVEVFATYGAAAIGPQLILADTNARTNIIRLDVFGHQGDRTGIF